MSVATTAMLRSRKPGIESSGEGHPHLTTRVAVMTV